MGGGGGGGGGYMGGVWVVGVGGARARQALSESNG